MSQNLAGSTFSASAAAPADQAAATYAALAWTVATAAEIMDFSGFDDDWERIEDNTYNASAAPSKKSRPRLGEVTLTLEYLKSNSAFYAIINAAELAIAGLVSCRFTHANTTDFIYFQAQVVKANDKAGSGTDKRSFEIVMLPQVKRVISEA